MTLNKIVAMGLADNSTEVFVRRGGASLGVLAHGNRNSDGVQKYMDSELEYFTWQDDNKVYADLKEGMEGGEKMKPFRVRFWHQDQDGREDCMEFDSMEQAQCFYDSLDGKAEIQRYTGERYAYEMVVAPTYEF